MSTTIQPVAVYDYAYVEDGPRGDDEGVVLAVREFTVVIASEVHFDRIAYDRRLVTVAAQ